MAKVTKKTTAKRKKQEVPYHKQPARQPQHLKSGPAQRQAGSLNDNEATARLVEQIVEKDEKTGQTYIKLPVESEAVVKDVFQLLGNLFKSMGQT